VTQGNQFGRTGGKWMTSTKFRALWNAGLTLDELAEANDRSENWKPTRSAVRKHADALELGRRRASHKELLPWKVQAEHNDDLLRHMLQAESRKRHGKELSETDLSLVSRLHELLFGRGKLMVVSYHPEVGFGLVMREDWDDDIIRRPRARPLADDGLLVRRLPMEEQASPGLAALDGGVSAQRQASGT
jgi:hypothetical protein